MVQHSLALLLVALSLPAASREVAITFDDLPRGGDSPHPASLPEIREMTRKLLANFKGVPVTGFVNAGQEQGIGAEGVQEVLRMWVQQGAELGNHSWSHFDINKTPLDKYTADITRGEGPIARAQGRSPVFYRHPFLRVGADAATKQGLEEFLRRNNYRVAPVTIDNSDYLFASVYAHAIAAKDTATAQRIRDAYLPYMESQFEFFELRAKEVFGRDIPQILLLHANQLNADTTPAMLAMIHKRGYTVVSLQQAMRDPAYSLPDTYVGPSGFSWIHRWSKAKGMKPRGEPEPEPWVQAELDRLRKALRPTL